MVVRREVIIKWKDVWFFFFLLICKKEENEWQLNIEWWVEKDEHRGNNASSHRSLTWNGTYRKLSRVWEGRL